MQWSGFQMHNTYVHHFLCQCHRKNVTSINSLGFSFSLQSQIPFNQYRETIWYIAVHSFVFTQQILAPCGPSKIRPFNRNTSRSRGKLFWDPLLKIEGCSFAQHTFLTRWFQVWGDRFAQLSTIHCNLPFFVWNLKLRHMCDWNITFSDSLECCFFFFFFF